MRNANQVQSILKNNGSKISHKSRKRKSKRKGVSARKMTNPKKAYANSKYDVLTHYERDEDEFRKNRQEEWPEEPYAKTTKTKKNDKSNQKDVPSDDKQD